MSSCVKDAPNPPASDYTFQDGRKVYFVNEGNYGSGNATLAIYNISKDVLSNNVFETVNKKPLGDVFQSICRVGDQLLLSINHSDNILICDPISLLQVGAVSAYAPRYFLPIHPSKVYVSSLYSHSILVLNTVTASIEKEIKVPSQSVEKMILHDGYVYASSWDENSTTIYKIDPNTDAIVKEIDFGAHASQDLLVDKYGKIWIKYGNIQKGKPYGFAVYNTLTDSVEKHFSFLEGENEWIKPVLNPTADTIYWINVNYAADETVASGLYRMSVTATTLPSTPFYKAAKFQYFYALAIDPLTNTIYLGDPKGFTGASEVILMDAAAQEIKRFQTGMGIGEFYFDN